MLLCVSIGAVSCAGTPIGIITSAGARDVEVDGKVITVTRIEGVHWGATNKAPTWSPKVATIEKPRYIRAVELISGCSVADADYDSHRDVLHARVACK